MTASNQFSERLTSETAPLLTVREVAARLRLSIASVYVMIRQGTLIAHRLGGRKGAIRIRPEDVDSCLDSAEQVHAPSKSARSSPRVKLKHIRL